MSPIFKSITDTIQHQIIRLCSEQINRAVLHGYATTTPKITYIIDGGCATYYLDYDEVFSIEVMDRLKLVEIGDFASGCLDQLEVAPLLRLSANPITIKILEVVTSEILNILDLQYVCIDGVPAIAADIEDERVLVVKMSRYTPETYQQTVEQINRMAFKRHELLKQFFITSAMTNKGFDVKKNQRMYAQLHSELCCTPSTCGFTDPALINASVFGFDDVLCIGRPFEGNSVEMYPPVYLSVVPKGDIVFSGDHPACIALGSKYRVLTSSTVAMREVGSRDDIHTSQEFMEGNARIVYISFVGDESDYCLKLDTTPKQWEYSSIDMT